MNSPYSKIEGQIGSGAFSSVYRVKSPKGTTNLALKLNFVDSTCTGTGSYMELQASLELAHYLIMRVKNVAEGDIVSQITDIDYRPYAGLKPDNLHFLYPLAEGNLVEFLQGIGKDFTLSIAMSICRDIGIAIEYMHAKSYIHRDIKPENILICKTSSGNHCCKICDLGISKYYVKYIVNSPSVSTGYYRAPEIALGNQYYDFGIDVWSLGCVFYEIFTSRKMFFFEVDTPLTLLTCIKENHRYKISTDYIRKINPKYLSLFSGIMTAGLADLPILHLLKRQMTTRKIRNLDVLLSRMLEFDHTKRIDMKGVLSSDFFDEKKSDIEITRNMYPPTPTVPSPAHKVIITEERNWMIECALGIYKNRNRYRWYDHRAFFLAIYNYDRVIAAGKKEIVNQRTCKIYFLSMIYLCSKVISREIADSISLYGILDNDMHNEADIEKANIFSHRVVKEIFGYIIRIPTIIEYAYSLRVPSTDDITSMLMFVKSGGYSQLTPEKSYSMWTKSKITYDVAARTFIYL